MLRFSKIWSRHPDNLKRIIIVGADDYLRSMEEAFAGAFTDDADTVHYIDTMEEVEVLMSGEA